jgi:hypothetical protein
MLQISQSSTRAGDCASCSAPPAATMPTSGARADPRSPLVDPSYRRRFVMLRPTLLLILLLPVLALGQTNDLRVSGQRWARVQ